MIDGEKLGVQLGDGLHQARMSLTKKINTLTNVANFMGDHFFESVGHFCQGRYNSSTYKSPGVLVKEDRGLCDNIPDRFQHVGRN